MHKEVEPTRRNSRVQPWRYDRRTMLRQLAFGAAACAAPLSLKIAWADTQGGNTPSDDVKERLRGAVLSIPTSFTSDNNVDLDGVRRMIERALPHNIRVFSLTSGNSQYVSLEYEEIVQLTQVMVEAAGDRGLTIAATGNWEVPQTIEYARFSESVGADSLQVLRPSITDESQVVEYFQRVADQTRLPLILHGEFSHSLLEGLIDIETIVGLKEDVGLEHYIQVQRKFGERLAIFGGGPEYAFLVAYPYGGRASYTTLGTFVPHITRKFWDAIDRDDLMAAYSIVKKYEHPFFDRWSHAFWRASLEHFGVASRFLRPPQESFDDEQMREVAAFYRSLGLS